MTGFLACALRLDLPAVCAPGTPQLLSPSPWRPSGSRHWSGDAAEVAVKVGHDGAPRPKDLVQSFSLANALRAGLSVGGGPELLVHLSALAREAGEVGFPQTLRVLAPETEEITATNSDWFAEAWSRRAPVVHGREDTPSPDRRGTPEQATARSARSSAGGSRHEDGHSPGPRLGD